MKISNTLISIRSHAFVQVNAKPVRIKLSNRRKLHVCNFYRPQRSWGKVMFLQASVILLTGGTSPPRLCTPLDYVPPRLHTPRLCAPRTTYPPDYVPSQTTYPPGLCTPPGLGTPQGLHTPPDYIPLSRLRTPLDYVSPRGRSMCGRYASYWNAFLFL